MTPETIEHHVRALYEMTPLQDPSWDDRLTFSDPLVHIEGRDGVLRMFSRLAKMVPESRVVRCEPVLGPDGLAAHWTLEVDWRRSIRSRGVRIQSRLDVELVDCRIAGLTEHWRTPIRASGSPTGAVRKWLRRQFGRWSARPGRV